MVIRYCIDHTGAVGALSSRKMAGLPVQIILDAGQMCAPSCSQQRSRLLSLVELRLWSPREGQYACLHAKSFFIDGKMLILVSRNATHNGLDRNFEIRVRIEGSTACREFAGLFETFWPLAPAGVAQGQLAHECRVRQGGSVSSARVLPFCAARVARSCAQDRLSRPQSHVSSDRAAQAASPRAAAARV